jgi:hypothetical protein
MGKRSVELDGQSQRIGVAGRGPAALTVLDYGMGAVGVRDRVRWQARGVVRAEDRRVAAGEHCIDQRLVHDARRVLHAAALRPDRLADDGYPTPGVPGCGVQQHQRQDRAGVPPGLLVSASHTSARHASSCASIAGANTARLSVGDLALVRFLLLDISRPVAGVGRLLPQIRQPLQLVGNRFPSVGDAIPDLGGIVRACIAGLARRPPSRAGQPPGRASAPP